MTHFALQIHILLCVLFKIGNFAKHDPTIGAQKVFQVNSGPQSLNKNKQSQDRHKVYRFADRDGHATELELPTVDNLMDHYDTETQFVHNAAPHQLCDALSSGNPPRWKLHIEYFLFCAMVHYTLHFWHQAKRNLDDVSDDTTNVSILMYMESMSSFKAQSMDFDMDMYLGMFWADERLAHNCTHPILISDTSIMDMIWQPDLYLVNSKFAYLQLITTTNIMMLVYPDGMIFKSMRIYATVACAMNLRGFPMDTQYCNIKIQSFAYVKEVITLHWHFDSEAGYPIAHNPTIKLNDMDIVHKESSNCSNSYKMFRGYGSWSCLTATIVMQRLIVFHIIQTYVPTAMLVVISWLSFWLDARSAPARISLTITTLLTLTTMSNGARQDLPQVSYVKAMDIWLSFCTAFVFCVLLEYTLVSFCVTRRTTRCRHVRMIGRMTSTFGHQVTAMMSADNSKPPPTNDANVINNSNNRSSHPWTVRQAMNTATNIDSATASETTIQSPAILNSAQNQNNVKHRSRGHGGSMSEDIDTHRDSVEHVLLKKPKHHPLIEMSNNCSPSKACSESPYFRSSALNLGHRSPRSTEHSQENFFSRLRNWFMDGYCEGCFAPGFPCRKHARSEVLLHPCEICAQYWEMIGKRVDKVSRALFPALFTTFVLVYWAYYLCRECRLGFLCGDCYYLNETDVYVPTLMADSVQIIPP